MRPKRSGVSLLRDIALLLLLLWSFGQAILMVFVPETDMTPYVIAFTAMDLGVLVALLGRGVSGAAIGGTLTCAWVAWKLYMFYAYGTLLSIVDLCFVPLPLLGVGIALLFERSERSMLSENLMLRKQVEELVLVDEVTMLYNERAMCHDLQVMIHYALHNDKPITLMLIRLKYREELEHMLSAAQYGGLLRQLARVLSDSVRTEDRVYALDSHGTMAIVLTCPEDTAHITRGRIQKAVAATSFETLMDGDGSPDLCFAARQYSSEYGNDMLAFKRAVESELAYDV